MDTDFHVLSITFNFRLIVMAKNNAKREREKVPTGMCTLDA